MKTIWISCQQNKQKYFLALFIFWNPTPKNVFFNFFLSPWMVYLVFWMVYLVLGIMYLGFEMMYLVKKEANLMTFKWLFIWWAVSWSEKLYQSFCLKGCRSCWWYSAKLYHIFVHPPSCPLLASFSTLCISRHIHFKILQHARGIMQQLIQTFCNNEYFIKEILPLLGNMFSPLNQPEPPCQPNVQQKLNCQWSLWKS